MKRTYSAPRSEYMTFTVDEVLAANCIVEDDQVASTFAGMLTLSGSSFYYGSDKAFSDSAECIAIVEGYCYYASANKIFNS